MGNWHSILEPLLTAAITLIGGYFLFTRTNIISTNIIQSRIEWLKNVKRKFTDLNNIITEVLAKIDDEKTHHREDETPKKHLDLFKEEIVQLQKAINDVTQDFKPLKTKYIEDNNEKEYMNIENKSEAQAEALLESTLTEILEIIRHYNDSKTINVNIPIFEGDEKEDSFSMDIEGRNQVYNYLQYKIEELKEIQKTITKIEWEKIKRESFVRKSSEFNEQDTLENNLNNISRQISKDFYQTESHDDIDKALSNQSTVFEILSKAIEKAENKGALPNSMLTTSKKRYIYTHEYNDTHPNGRKLFNPKLYKGKYRNYTIETNFSKNYAEKLATKIKSYGD